MDPTASLISVIIITFSAWPLVRDCSWILLQSSPSDIPLYDSNVSLNPYHAQIISWYRLKQQLLRIPFVKDIHELHLWQLIDGLTIGSAHVILSSDAPWEKVRRCMINMKLQNYWRFPTY
jgi:Co/Zn/Cd efflux system component